METFKTLHILLIQWFAFSVSMDAQIPPHSEVLLPGEGSTIGEAENPRLGLEQTLCSWRIYSHAHRQQRETYGAPRIHFELRMLGVRCGRKRVARLMRETGLRGCGGCSRKAPTTVRSQSERTPLPPDPVKRNFTPEAPDRLWVADLTYVRSWEGWLYLSFVLDTYSGKFVG